MISEEVLKEGNLEVYFLWPEFGPGYFSVSGESIQVCQTFILGGGGVEVATT